MAEIGKVVIRPVTRTTISSPNFNPTPNVALNELRDVITVFKNDGDVLQYDAANSIFITAPLEQANVNIHNIYGGLF